MVVIARQVDLGMRTYKEKDGPGIMRDYPLVWWLRENSIFFTSLAATSY